MSSFSLLLYLFHKGWSYLRMIFICGFVQPAPTSFIFVSGSLILCTSVVAVRKPQEESDANQSKSSLNVLYIQQCIWSCVWDVSNQTQPHFPFGKLCCDICPRGWVLAVPPNHWIYLDHCSPLSINWMVITLERKLWGGILYLKCQMFTHSSGIMIAPLRHVWGVGVYVCVCVCVCVCFRY